MDPFIDKCKAYGLCVRRIHNYEFSKRYFQLIYNSGSENDLEHKLSHIFSSLTIAVNDSDKLFATLGFDEENTKGVSAFAKTMKISPYNGKVDKMIFLEMNIDIDEVDDLFGHFNDNSDFYEQHFPEWKIKRLFNKTAADESLTICFSDRLCTFFEYAELSGKLTFMYDDLYRSLQESLIPQKVTC